MTLPAILAAAVPPSGAGPITLFDASQHSSRFACEVKGFDPLRWVQKKDVKKIDRFIQFAIAAADFDRILIELEFVSAGFEIEIVLAVFEDDLPTVGRVRDLDLFAPLLDGELHRVLGFVGDFDLYGSLRGLEREHNGRGDDHCRKTAGGGDQRATIPCS